MREIADAVLVDDKGEDVVVGSVWQDQPAAVVFLRHFGCTFCREHAAELQERFDEIEDAAGTAVAIGMGTPAHAAEFRRMSGIEFPLLVAPDTSLHEDAGLTRGNWFRVLRPIGSIARNLPRYGAKLTDTDMSQLGGTFVVAPGGRVLYAQRAKTSADNAPIDDVIGAIRAAAANSPTVPQYTS